jgi:hypothetical protein
MNWNDERLSNNIVSFFLSAKHLFEIASPFQSLLSQLKSFSSFQMQISDDGRLFSPSKLKIRTKKSEQKNCHSLSDQLSNLLKLLEEFVSNSILADNYLNYFSNFELFNYYCNFELFNYSCNYELLLIFVLLPVFLKKFFLILNKF